VWLNERRRERAVSDGGRGLRYLATVTAMLRLTFRTKLLLAMMLVVAAFHATLLVTQRRVQANYERTFRGQFEQQIDYFTSLQDARLEWVKEMSQLAQSVRARIMKNQRSTPTSTHGDDELRGVLKPGAPRLRVGRGAAASFPLHGRARQAISPENSRAGLTRRPPG
jgi:hypothetical protein